VVTLAQLEAAGLGRSGAARRVANGRLHRVHRGVYAVGHDALSNESRWVAAVLACGPSAVLSHRSAAELWQLLKPIAGPVEVTVRTVGGRARRPGLRIHRCPSLPARSTCVRRGIPLTTTARTLFDLQLCRRHGLPDPERNVRVGRFTVDFLWRDQGLVVETDGYAATAAARRSSTTAPASSSSARSDSNCADSVMSR
jgi:hypothetical protein